MNMRSIASWKFAKSNGTLIFNQFPKRSCCELHESYVLGCITVFEKHFLRCGWCTFKKPARFNGLPAIPDLAGHYHEWTVSFSIDGAWNVFLAKIGFVDLFRGSLNIVTCHHFVGLFRGFLNIVTCHHSTKSIVCPGTRSRATSGDTIYLAYFHK